MPNVVDFNTAERIAIRITELIDNIPGRPNGDIVAALLVALGDFIESIDCPNCRITATEEVCEGGCRHSSMLWASKQRPKQSCALNAPLERAALPFLGDHRARPHKS
jgi:hypothetical protein